MLWVCPTGDWWAKNVPNRWPNAFQIRLCFRCVERTWSDRQHYLLKYPSDFQCAKIFKEKLTKVSQFSKKLSVDGASHLLVYKWTDRCKWSQIAWDKKYVAIQCYMDDFLSCIFGTFFITTRHINLCTASRQIDSRLFANASIATCDFIIIILLKASTRSTLTDWQPLAVYVRSMVDMAFTCNDGNFSR